MGANQSVDLLVGQKFEETSFNVKNDTHFVREMNSDLYGESQLMQYKESVSHPYLVLKSRLVASKSEYDEYIKEPQKRKNLRSPYVVPLLNIYQIKQSDYCSKYYKVYMLFAYCEKTLFDTMIEFNEQQHTFTEGDILQMIENVLQGLVFLKENGISHDMIKSSTIAVATPAQQQNTSGIAEYLSNSSKKVNTTQSANKQNNTQQDNNLYTSVFNNPNIKYMISDSKFMHNGKDAYMQALLGDTQDFYLSPQLFSRLKHRYISGFSASNPEEQHSSDVSQVFSLGMVAVEMATLKSVRKIYDFDYFSLNKGRLMNKLEVIAELYSPQLAFIIAKMLTFNEKDRLTLSQTLNLVHNYQENPQQFLDINFNPEIILENYNQVNTEGDNQNNPSQQVIKTHEDEDSELIKRAHKDNNQQNQSETKELYTFKQPTSAEGNSDIGNNIHIITNSSNRNDEFNKSRSKSPNSVPVKDYPVKEFATPNKFNNDQFTPGQTASSQNLRGLSTALHNQNSLSSQKNNNNDHYQRNNNPQQPISEYNYHPQSYQYHPESESQIRFHRDEIHSGPNSNNHLNNSSKSGGKSSQFLQSQKLSNPTSRVPSQQLLHYDQPDFKLEKDYENPNQGKLDYLNTGNYNKMKPTDPIDRKKYSHSYSQSLIASSLNNTIKAQGNPYTSQSQKIEHLRQSNYDQIRQSNPDQIRQSSQSHHGYSKTMSEILSEGNNIQFSKKLPNNYNNQFNQTSGAPVDKKYVQNYDNNFQKRSLTPDFTKIDFDGINKSIKMNAPASKVSPKQNNQKGEVYHQRQPSNKSNRSESLIGSNQRIQSPLIDSSQNHNQKYSIKFSPKNVTNSQQINSPNFFKSSNSSSGVKRAGPPSKSIHVSNPSSTSQVLKNSNLQQPDQNNRTRQPSNLSQQPNNNQLQIPGQGNYYYRNPSNQNSHNSSLQRNDDSISVQVPNEIDANNMEFPQQRIYNFDVKTISDTKDRQLFSPQQSQYLQDHPELQQQQHEAYNNNYQPYNNSYSQKSYQPGQNIQLNQPENSNKIIDSGHPNYIQSIGYSNILNNNNNKSQQNQSNLYPSQSQRQNYQPNQSQKLQDQPSQSFRNLNSNYNNPYFIQSASSLAIAHNLMNGSGQIDQSNSIKEQHFVQPPHQNIYSLIQQRQQQERTNNFSKTDPIDIKSIIKENNNDNMLDNSLINQNLTINGPPTPRNSIRGSRNMYHLYEKSPNKDDLHYKLEKVTIPEEEYNKDIQQTISELEQKIKDFDSRISKQKLGNSKIGSEMHVKSQDEKQSTFQKFLNSFSCKSNNNVVREEENPNAPQQRTPLKNLFTDDRLSPERFPINEEVNYNNNRASQQKPSPNPYSQSRQNSHYNGSLNSTQQQRQNIHQSRSPVQNSRDMKAFFQNTTPFAENQY